MQPPDRQLHHLLQCLDPLTAPGAPGKNWGYTGCGGNQKDRPHRLAAHQPSRPVRIPEAAGCLECRCHHSRPDWSALTSNRCSGRLTIVGLRRSLNHESWNDGFRGDMQKTPTSAGSTTPRGMYSRPSPTSNGGLRRPGWVCPGERWKKRWGGCYRAATSGL